jgi:hypothetical protein
MTTSGKLPQKPTVKLISMAVAISFVCAIAIALICGLIALAFAYIPVPLDTLQKQGILNAIVLVLALGFAPVPIHTIFYGMRLYGTVKARIYKSLHKLKHYYVAILTITIAAVVVGWCVQIGFGMFAGAQSLPMTICVHAITLVIGIASIIAIYRMLYMPRVHKNEKRPGELRARGPRHVHRKPAYTETTSEPVYTPKHQLSERIRHIRSATARTALALIMVFGSIPSVWLLAGQSIKEAYADSIVKQYEYGTAAPSDTPATLKAPTLSDKPQVPQGATAEESHDMYSRTYLMANGTHTTRIQSEPITYIDDNGDTKDIDDTLIDKGDSYQNKANSYTATLPKDGGAISIEKDGYTLDTAPTYGTLTNAVAKGDAIMYNDVADNVDVQYAAFGSALKEDIVLEAPTSLSGFGYTVNADGITFKLDDNVVYGYADSDIDDYGNVIANAKAVFSIDAPAMTDADGNTSDGIVLSLTDTGDSTDNTATQAGTTKTGPAGSVSQTFAHSAALTLTPDATWLTAPARAYPVHIDPSHALTNDNLTQATVQALKSGPSSGPDKAHDISYLYTGLEDGSLVSMKDTDGTPIRYGECWAFIKINDITPYITGLPDRAILSATLDAYDYAQCSGAPGNTIDAKMVSHDWYGDGRYTWNNRPYGGDLTYLSSDAVPNGDGWMKFDITDAFKSWKNNGSTNKGIMLTPESERQPAVCFSGTGNEYGQHALYIDLSWTVPKPVDEDMALTAPNVNLRPLAYKNGQGIQNVVGLSADGVVRPALQVDYDLDAYDTDGTSATMDSGTYAKADYEPNYPNTDLFKDQLQFTLGYTELYQSNWQSKLFKGDDIAQDTL